jgi:predicted kinase
MQGVSGSGKSTLARRLRDACPAGTCVIVSADALFFGPDGTYTFDPTKLDEAHNECFRNFLRALVDDNVQVILVDNTNTLSADCAPYMRAASAFGWKPRILRVECDPAVALGRNGGRAPAKVVDGQARNLEYQTLPAYWKVSTVKAGEIPEPADLLVWPVF